MIGKMAGWLAVVIILGMSALPGSAYSSEQYVVVRPIEILEINATDPTELQMVFVDLQTKTSYRTHFRDSLSLFGGDLRQKLFQSFADRSEIWVELVIQTARGKFRSVEIVRTTEPPNSK